MKKSKTETAETRKRIVEIAAQAFKSKGIHATGVAEIMAAAGLSHGGFYRHFSSKEQLVAEACAASMDILVGSAEAAAEGGRETLVKHLEEFLSAEYRDDRLSGCPLVAMGSELVRADSDTRRAASTGFEELIDVVAGWTKVKDPEVAEDDAIFTLSSMIGAVTMARIVDSPELSDRILQVAKQRLVRQPPKSPPKKMKPQVA